MSQLKKPCVLSLNANWQRTGWLTPQRAIISLTGGITTVPSLAIDIQLDAEGNITGVVPVSWDEFVKLPVRASDWTIATKNGPIRCPVAIIEPNHSRMSLKEPRLTNRAILERDNYIDQYTGERLRPQDASVDHVIPKDLWKKLGLKGSPNTWTNMVCCRKDRNHRKGNKTNGSMGLALIRKPQAPKRIPVSFFYRQMKHPHQAPFFKDVHDE